MFTVWIWFSQIFRQQQSVSGKNAVLADVADAFHGKCWSWRRRAQVWLGSGSWLGNWVKKSSWDAEIGPNALWKFWTDIELPEERWKARRMALWTQIYSCCCPAVTWLALKYVDRVEINWTWFCVGRLSPPFWAYLFAVVTKEMEHSLAFVQQAGESASSSTKGLIR